MRVWVKVRVGVKARASNRAVPLKIRGKFFSSVLKASETNASMC